MEEFNALVPYFGAWVVVCALLSFVIARQKGMKPLVPTLAGLVAAFIPIVGVIYLVFLATRETSNRGP